MLQGPNGTGKFSWEESQGHGPVNVMNTGPHWIRAGRFGSLVCSPMRFNHKFSLMSQFKCEEIQNLTDTATGVLCLCWTSRNSSTQMGAAPEMFLFKHNETPQNKKYRPEFPQPLLRGANRGRSVNSLRAGIKPRPCPWFEGVHKILPTTS